MLLQEIVEYIQSEDGLAGEAASVDGEAGGGAVELDLEAGGGSFGGTLPPLPSGAGHVAVEIDPTTSLSSAAGELPLLLDFLLRLAFFLLLAHLLRVASWS